MNHETYKAIYPTAPSISDQLSTLCISEYEAYEEVHSNQQIDDTEPYENIKQILEKKTYLDQKEKLQQLAKTYYRIHYINSEDDSEIR